MVYISLVYRGISSISTIGHSPGETGGETRNWNPTNNDIRIVQSFCYVFNVLLKFPSLYLGCFIGWEVTSVT